MLCTLIRLSHLKGSIVGVQISCVWNRLIVNWWIIIKFLLYVTYSRYFLRFLTARGGRILILHLISWLGCIRDRLWSMEQGWTQLYLTLNSGSRCTWLSLHQARAIAWLPWRGKHDLWSQGVESFYSPRCLLILYQVLSTPDFLLWILRSIINTCFWEGPDHGSITIGKQAI